MSPCIIVSEGDLDMLVLRELVHPRLGQFHGIQGRSAAVSLARSLLATRTARVGLVLDADALDPDAVDRNRAELISSLAAAGGRERFHVFLVVPTLERWLLADEEALRSYLGQELPQDAQIRAQFEPKKLLVELLKSAGRPPLPKAAVEIAKRIDPKKIADLDGEFVRLRDFVNDPAVLGRAV